MLIPLLIHLIALQPRTGVAETNYRLQTRETRRIHAELSYRVLCKNLRASEWVFFAPQAPELPGQTQVHTVIEPTGDLVYESGTLRRPLLRARIQAGTPESISGAGIRVVYEATLHSRRLEQVLSGSAPIGVPALSEHERKRALLDGGDYDWNAESFRRWLRLRQLYRGRREGVIAFATRVFLTIKDRFRYEYLFDQDRRASAVCGSGRSDCGGLCVLFVSIMRANDIPSRALYGRWAESARPAEKLNGVTYYQWHVMAEFFAEGVGWVPVDPACAVRYDRSLEGLDYFGADRGDFLVQHIDPDLELDTVHFGKKRINSLQIPAFWVTGSGSRDPTAGTEDWQVRELR